MNTDHTTAVAACRLSYRVLFAHLPCEDAADHVREITRAWKAGDSRDLFSVLEAARYALADVVGAYDAHAAMRAANALVVAS